MSGYDQARELFDPTGELARGPANVQWYGSLADRLPGPGGDPGVGNASGRWRFPLADRLPGPGGDPGVGNASGRWRFPLADRLPGPGGDPGGRHARVLYIGVSCADQQSEKSSTSSKSELPALCRQALVDH